MNKSNYNMDIKMEYQNITMIKGDTVAFNVEVFDENNEPVTIDSAYLTCKKIPSRETVTFQKTLGNGIGQHDGLISVRIAPEDTREVDAGNYFYDLQIGLENDVFTILIGTLTIEQDVTY